MTTMRDRQATGHTLTLPPLPLEAWEGTKDTLQRYVGALSAVRRALNEPRNHWWHIPLYVTPRGLTTRPMPGDDASLEIQLDLIDHEAIFFSSRGERHRFPLADGLSVARFHEQAAAHLDALGAPVAVRHAEFAGDHAHASYDREAAHRFWQILVWVEPVLRAFAARYTGKTSPVHLFWHSFDLVVTRYHRPQGAEADGQHAYEEISFGFWPGDDRIKEPAFYVSVFPEPEGLTVEPLRPEQAVWQAADSGNLALLRYEDVRQAASPRDSILFFFESAYQAGAGLAGWDVAALTFDPDRDLP